MATYSDTVLEDIRNELVALNGIMRNIYQQSLETNRLLRKENVPQTLNENIKHLEKLERLTNLNDPFESYIKEKGPNGDNT